MSIDFYQITGYSAHPTFGQIADANEVENTNLSNDIWFQVLDMIVAIWPETKLLWPEGERAVGDIKPDQCLRFAFTLDRIIRIARKNVTEPAIKITGGDGHAEMIDMSARENGFANLSEGRIMKLEAIRDALRTPGLGFYWA
jgi:hypothetical protein